MSGDGFHFQAPAAWTVARKADSVAASSGPVSLVEVVHFTLEKPYRVSRFAAVARELDGVAAGLAKQSSGRVASRSTVQVAGRKTRYYRIDFGPGKTEEIAFVLDGSDEFQLLCRRRASAADTFCRQLFSSFALG